ncbi:bifunctional phosphopantothenoylcysteine decarboxylase/phosphopantothenate--cysteine ligase CoaBC [Thermohalobacter berrensis]|uniref:Coenzyme A biosynthesis bifunctional protein CoaBC n=1 Tax=Thermohalobacter berrensis TaxID=99594 RepID=A0A419TA51_9FIRM|nr:bifunctional phosphopantothenoylcysteine decarboxylase/phosphopantothenate--cysteine ligase CoaBC [Thermohalobacter berrensis]RKD34359.1 phosphopantothenoylcysteine decarboxylase [Thermohalobacter berrensis]
MLHNKNIVMGVTGGIAAYKAVDVVSRLKKLNANIDIIMTESAAKFVTPLTFQTLSQNKVTVDMFERPRNWDVEHISLAKKADIFLIAPATANIIGKVANGIADDMLSTTIMATKSKVVFAPAMNTNMYNNPIFKSNMEKLKGLGYEFIKTGSGRLACGDYGEGKMAEPEEIVEYVVNKFANNDLKGKKVVVTAGPTIEPLDLVRYLTNYSSGKMGYLLAEEAKQRGADVILISGPTNTNPPCGIKFVEVKTTNEMFNAVGKYFNDCDVLIKAAAPLDYRPVNVQDKKIKKDKDQINIQFIKNPDILAHFGNKKKNQIVVGFAAESEQVIQYAQEKLNKKNLDLIIANDISKKDAGFRADTNIVSIIDRKSRIEEYPKMTKKELSKIIIDKIISILKSKS